MAAHGENNEELRLFQTGEHPCGYWPERQARDLVLDPQDERLGALYPMALTWGFRRSGDLVYRPHCEGCRACVPVRIPVERFVPNRSQRRCAKRNMDLRARELPLVLFDEHFELYQRYQAARHAGGGMDHDSHEQYANFLLQSRVDSRLIEFTEHGELRMVSIIDILNDGVSSVYTFYDPDIPGAGFGTYNILWQIAQCSANNLPYLYLGYWIRESRKMAYKADFRPIEGLLDGVWQELPTEGNAIRTT